MEKYDNPKPQNLKDFENLKNIGSLKNPAKTVAFTGHRTFDASESEIKSITYGIVLEMCAQGYDTFLTGMAEGFDLIAAEAVLCAKNRYPEISLIAVIPFPQQAERFSFHERKKFYDVLSQTHLRFILYEKYFEGIFLRRNDFLIENASKLICYFTGKRGGTMYTVNRAKKANLSITNIYNISTDLAFFPK